jgi:phage terminase large subunit-like protein
LAELRTTRRQQQTTKEISPGALDLLDFVPAMNPRYERPEHLARIAELFARAETEEVRALISVPPQHGKSEMILNGIARSLRRQPWKRNAYASFGDRPARKKSLACRDLAVAAGVTIRDDAQGVSDWQTPEGGGLLATGVGGPLTGNPVDGMLVIDDPHKDRAEAESALIRERIHDWYTSTARTRVHPGASVIVVHTRWHQDDLIGRLSKETKEGPDGTEVPAWEVINLPAIQPDGSPLWHQRPLSFLAQHRTNEHDWWSLWMGSPRPRGSSVFRGVHFYDHPPVRFRIGKGVDLAYTARTHADWSVGIVLIREDREIGAPLFYVVDVRRKQAEVPAFVAELEQVDAIWPGSWHWFCSTTERGVAQLVTRGGVHVEPVLATADKFVRAQEVATAWNEGRVLVPRHAQDCTSRRDIVERCDGKCVPWLRQFVDEIAAFTGVGDRRDDQVDGLASAFEQVRHTAAKARTSSRGDRRYSDMGGYGRG